MSQATERPPSNCLAAQQPRLNRPERRLIQIRTNGLNHRSQIVRPVRDALGTVGPSPLSCVGCRDALDLRGDDIELRGQLWVDALKAIGHRADHAGWAAAVATSFHDNRPRVFHEPFGVAQAIIDLKTKRGVHCRKSSNHRSFPSDHFSIFSSTARWSTRLDLQCAGLLLSPRK